jgi:MFS family permease
LTGTESLVRGYAGHLFVALTLGAGTIKLGRFLLPPLLPSVIESLAITSFEAGVAMSAVGVAFAVIQYPSGRLADALSRKTVLIASMGLSLLGFLVLVRTFTYALFVAGVAMVGLGDGLYAPAARAQLSDLYRERRGQAFGVHMAFIDVGGIGASGLAVAILAVATWRAAFLPVVAVLAGMLLLLGVISRESVVVARVDLNVRETAARLVGDRFLLWIVLVYALVVFTWQGILSFLPIFLQTEHGFSTALSSGVFSLLFVTGILAKPLAGRLSDGFSRLTVAAGALATATAGVGLLVASPVLPGVVAGVFLYAAGHKAFAPVVQAFFMDVFPEESKAGDLGSVRTVYLLFASLGPTYVGSVSTVASYATAFAGFIAVLSLSALLVGYLYLDDR